MLSSFAHDSKKGKLEEFFSTVFFHETFSNGNNDFVFHGSFSMFPWFFVSVLLFGDFRLSIVRRNAV
jgi:hypothetical protein